MKDILRLLKLTRPFAGTYSTALAALIVGSVAFLLIPNQLGRLVAALQDVEAGRGGKAAANAAIAGAALLALHGVASLVYTFLVSLVSERIINDLRARFFSSLVNQRLDQHPPKALGQIASEFASDLSLVQNGLSTTLIDCVRHGLVTAGSLIALFLINAKMTLLALVGVGGVAGVILLFIRKATASIMSVQQWRGEGDGAIAGGRGQRVHHPGLRAGRVHEQAFFALAERDVLAGLAADAADGVHEPGLPGAVRGGDDRPGNVRHAAASRRRT